MSNILILVPARYASSRFPGKPLAKINQRCMIDYVVDNCRSTGFDYAIVTDNDEIEAHVKNIGGQCVRIDDDVPSGSERIALAYGRFFNDKSYDLVINVQGDEPLLDAKVMKGLADFHLENKHFDITTLIRPRTRDEQDFHNANVVKCVFSPEQSRCLYFSRSSVPFDRESQTKDWFQHIGIYSYRPEALKKFVELPFSEIESIEKLEQLRALSFGMSIGAKKENVNLIGVDTPEDIAKIEGVLSGKEK